MTSTTLASLLDDVRRRNDELGAAYKAVSRRMLSRSVITFTASASEQRRELGESLAEVGLVLEKSLLETPIPLAIQPPAQAPGEATASDDPSLLLRYFRDVEGVDRDIFIAAAALPGLDPDTAARFSAFAEQARKRSSMAGDHLDLLALG